jgi:glucose/arabinose dehydrogenase
MQSQPVATPVPDQTPILQAVGERPVHVSLQLIAEGFTSPVALAEPPDGSGLLYVVDQIGVITILDPANPDTERRIFLDLQHKMTYQRSEYDERGLLGLAFHPDFAENGRFFVAYSTIKRPGAPESWDHTSRFSEFRIDPETGLAYPESETVLIDIDHPFESHNGGTLAFGPDGYLYLSIGDGGAVGDPMDQGQDIVGLLGSILRIDINSGDPYSIPPDNPFANGEEGAPEIYAYGLRNPYRFSFDPLTGLLVAGDVGQNLFEEVDVIQPGQNYGWSMREATSCFNLHDPIHPLDSCGEVGRRADPLVMPVLEYPHDLGIAVIGGYIYRGSAIPNLYGRYLFGDWGQPEKGLLMVATPQDQGTWPFEVITLNGSTGGLGVQLTGLGIDAEGELYALTKEGLGPVGTTGKVWKIVPEEQP